MKGVTLEDTSEKFLFTLEAAGTSPENQGSNRSRSTRFRENKGYNRTRHQVSQETNKTSWQTAEHRTRFKYTETQVGHIRAVSEGREQNR